MMARERYETALKCPKCGRTGKADMSDKKSTMIEVDYDTQVDGVPEEFKTVGRDVFCEKCNVSATPS